MDRQSNQSSRLLEKAQSRIGELENDIREKQEEEKRLKEQLGHLLTYLRDLAKLDYRPVSRPEAELLGKAAEQPEGAPLQEEKARIVEKLEAFTGKEQKEIEENWAVLTAEMKQISDRKSVV